MYPFGRYDLFSELKAPLPAVNVDLVREGVASTTVTSPRA